MTGICNSKRGRYLKKTIQSKKSKTEKQANRTVPMMKFLPKDKYHKTISSFSCPIIWAAFFI
jgi:hypothetical protein